MVVDADLKSAHALNGFYMLFSRRHGRGPAEALVRREWPPNKDRPLPVVLVVGNHRPCGLVQHWLMLRRRLLDKTCGEMMPTH
jgi:hypothetical protein